MRRHSGKWWERIRLAGVLSALVTITCFACSNSATTEGNMPSDRVVVSALSGIDDPGAMVLDRRGNLYIVDRGKCCVFMVFPGGSVTTLAENLNGPKGLAVDPGGRLYVCESGSGNIRRIYPDGTTTVVVSGLNSPETVVPDRDGGLFVACSGDNRIVYVMPESL